MCQIPSEQDLNTEMKQWSLRRMDVPQRCLEVFWRCLEVLGGALEVLWRCFAGALEVPGGGMLLQDAELSI